LYSTWLELYNTRCELCSTGGALASGAGPFMVEEYRARQQQPPAR
jgi:hypothetical protein